jgi:hypothetical protein
MKATSIKPALFLTSIAFLFFLAACAPKCVIKGQVVDAETNQPINGAAVAIRWFENPSETESGTTQTFAAAQDLSDEHGTFSVPLYADKNFTMGAYKEGYICWSSRSAFAGSANEKPGPSLSPPVENGMQIRLKPIKEEDSRDEHAAFAVLVAGEVTQSQKGPFYKAILPLFRKWRDNLRREFRRETGYQPTVEPH